MKIFVTGAAGYVGSMLVQLLLKDERVSQVTALDMKPKPQMISDNPKLVWVDFNLGDDGWQAEVLKHGNPDIVIHCAYIVRQGFGKERAWQNKCNLTAADKLFDFVFKNNISRLIHFSTVASYGARPENKLNEPIKESHPLNEEKYLYGVDKKIIEEKLQSAFEKSAKITRIFVVRPCAITGPYGQNIYSRFGLLKAVKKTLPIVPVTGKNAARQYVHEDDVADIVFHFCFDLSVSQYEVFNLAPPGYFLIADMARQNGKMVLRVPAWLGRLGFAFLWYGSCGRIPVVPEAINSYTYPIIADGSKIEQAGYSYKYSVAEALAAKKGRFGQEE